MAAPRVLILGDSFIRRVHQFIKRYTPELDMQLHITEPLVINWHGVGGRTAAKIIRHDLRVVESFHPDIVVLQLGTNDLTGHPPVLVGSAIEDLVRLLHDSFGVKFVCVCQTIHRDSAGAFNKNVGILTKYLKVVLEPLVYARFWSHRGFWNSPKDFYAYDGVHLNSRGQHKFYRSLRGAVLKCLRSLASNGP